MKYLLIPCFLGLVVACCASQKDDTTHGLKILGKMLRQFLNSRPADVKISEGVHLVKIKSASSARGFEDDGTLAGAVMNYLNTHEILIRLPELMPSEEFGRSFKEAYEEWKDDNDPSEARGKGGGGGGGGGGKGGGGGGGMMLLGMMFAKTLAAIGLGGVGLLAKKALMVSVIALVLSLILALKKLVHHEDHDEGGHTVIHASHGHHHEYRKKRDASELAYKAWKLLNAH